MKRLMPLLFLSIATFFLSEAQEVSFFEGTWEEALAQAESRQVPILFDAYTDWCYWCKVQDRETFADPEIASYINEHFVPFKINMEKGQGIDLAMKFRVTGFPTTLFFNADGQLVDKLVGYLEDKQEYMKQLGEVRQAKAGRHFGYDSHVLDVGFPEFYKNAFTGYADKRVFPEPETVVAFLEGRDNLLDEVSWSVMFRFQSNEQFDQYFLEHFKRYVVLYGENETESKLTRIAYDMAGKAAENGDEAKLDKAIELVREHFPDGSETLEFNLRSNYYQKGEDWNGYANLLASRIEKEGTEDVNLINAMTWTLYENCDDVAQLERAAGWMKSVVGQAPEYMYLDTYAALLYKSGQLEEAERWAKTAIETGEANDDDVSSTEELLELIRSAY